MAESELELPVFAYDESKLSNLAVKLQQTFGLELFGIDVIIENVTGRYAIIDINTFPGMIVIQTMPILQKLNRNMGRVKATSVYLQLVYSLGSLLLKLVVNMHSNNADIDGQLSYKFMHNTLTTKKPGYS